MFFILPTTPITHAVPCPRSRRLPPLTVAHPLVPNRKMRFPPQKVVAHSAPSKKLPLDYRRCSPSIIVAVPLRLSSPFPLKYRHRSPIPPQLLSPFPLQLSLPFFFDYRCRFPLSPLIIATVFLQLLSLFPPLPLDYCDHSPLIIVAVFPLPPQLS